MNQTRLPGLWIGLLACCISAIVLAQPSREGQRLYDKQEYNRAEQAFLRMGKDDPDALYNAGNAAYQQGQYERAAQLFEKAATVPSAVRADALYNAGNAYLRQGNYSAAIQAYERSLRLQPAQPDAKRNLQIARHMLQPHEPPPPPPPPPPLPPPPSEAFLDPPRPLSPSDSARRLSEAETKQWLQEVVEREEGKNARIYRSMPSSTDANRRRKRW